ncbi:MAG: hypothetical protein OHK0011_01040 [Turneriella sp.]
MQGVVSGRKYRQFQSMSAKKSKRLRKVVGKIVRKTGAEVVTRLKRRIAYLSVCMLVSVLFNIALAFLLGSK